MGRSFSVLLFCVAMDPVLTYLNRIPGMLAVQGYVDDTTMVETPLLVCNGFQMPGIYAPAFDLPASKLMSTTAGKLVVSICMAPAPATLTSTLPCNGRMDYKDMLHCGKPLFTERVMALPLLYAEPISLFVFPQQMWISYWQEDMLP